MYSVEYEHTLPLSCFLFSQTLLWSRVFNVVQSLFFSVAQDVVKQVVGTLIKTRVLVCHCSLWFLFECVYRITLYMVYMEGFRW